MQELTSKELEQYLTKYNLWRRGDENIKMPEPKELGLRIDQACKLIRDMQAQLTTTQQALDSLKEDNVSLEESLEALKNKLGDNCRACSYDNIEDVCMAHTPKLIEVQKKLDVAVEALEWQPIETAPRGEVIDTFGCWINKRNSYKAYIRNCDDFIGENTVHPLIKTHFEYEGATGTYTRTHWRRLPPEPQAALSTIRAQK